jgi:hypothetical protein
MTVDELKEWMEERFDRVDKRLDCMNGKITSHDRWLWLMRGLGIAVITILGFLGVRVAKI